MASDGVHMAPFGALKSLMLDHFGFRNSMVGYVGSSWAMLTHLESILGSREALLGQHEVILGALGANMEAIIALSLG